MCIRRYTYDSSSRHVTWQGWCYCDYGYFITSICAISQTWLGANFIPRHPICSISIWYVVFSHLLMYSHRNVSWWPSIAAWHWCINIVMSAQYSAPNALFCEVLRTMRIIILDYARLLNLNENQVLSSEIGFRYPKASSMIVLSKITKWAYLSTFGTTSLHVLVQTGTKPTSGGHLVP